jgi:hypothetical protein
MIFTFSEKRLIPVSIASGYGARLFASYAPWRARIARESAKTIDWLVDRYKLPLSCVLDFRYPGHSQPHMHASPSRFGAELLAVLLNAVEAVARNEAWAGGYRHAGQDQRPVLMRWNGTRWRR